MPRLLTLALLAACQTDTPQQNLPDWSAGYDDGTSTVDTGTPEVPSGALAVTVPTNTGIESRIHVTGATDPCEIYPDGTVEGYEETDCTIDIPELDLYGYGLNYDLTVPAGACEFVVYSHYMYEAWEVGTGPDEVSYEVDATGNIVNEVNSVGGVPYCEYDYTWQSSDSPNCCIGSYTLTVYDAAADETTTYPPLGWGGNPSDCYDGAAFYDPEATFSDDGWPLARIVFLQETAWTRRFTWPELSSRYYSNVPLANHYDPADHEGTLPAGLAGYWAQPQYVVECYDHAEELLGRITLNVQEWNEEAEYMAEGDPNTTGTEPISGEPIDDRNDWATATPDATSFIEWRQ